MTCAVVEGGAGGREGVAKMPPPPHVGMITGSGAKLQGTSGFWGGGGAAEDSQRLLCVWVGGGDNSAKAPS